MQEKYTKPNSDKELSEAEVSINHEMRTACWTFFPKQVFIFLIFSFHVMISFVLF